MKKQILGSVLLATSLMGFATTHVFADPADKITICHGTGQSDTTHFVTLTLSRNAVYQDQGNGGHFYENGTPKSGHEEDYIGECRVADPSVAPSADPSAEPSITPSSAPSNTPAPTNNNNTNDTNNDTASNNSSNNTNSTGGEVLGAYAETGVVEDVIMNVLGAMGGLMTTAGTVLYGRKKSSKITL